MPPASLSPIPAYVRGRGSGGRHFGGVALGLRDVRCEGVKVPEVEHR